MSTVIETSSGLEQIAQLDTHLWSEYESFIHTDPSLSRQLVSFQISKTCPNYRWYKFKEAFSPHLVEHLLGQYKVNDGLILDPFAGAGTTLFVASSLGLESVGVELLPIGQEVVKTRMLLQLPSAKHIVERLRYWRDNQPWMKAKPEWHLRSLRITQGAYPPETVEAIERYMSALSLEDASTQKALRLALLCVLEEVSFTRKDGQYLRWDCRSGRTWGKIKFDKGKISKFTQAIDAKLRVILDDVADQDNPRLIFPGRDLKAPIGILNGSCLELLPTLEAASFQAVFTSPPYCNRYDYTRTYALELALLGVDESGISELRQQMLSCTVENRAKDLLAMNENWERAIFSADRQELLQAILHFLDEKRAANELNNNGIPRMVRGYFYEMACVLLECVRLLKPGGLMFMVNDNVRYAGASISVDLILSDIASRLGFEIDSILVLPNGKGNSSQQMGEHGRESLRKCVYVWRKSHGA
jgi:DNA modification methylase